MLAISRGHVGSVSPVAKSAHMTSRLMVILLDQACSKSVHTLSIELHVESRPRFNLLQIQTLLRD